MQPNVCCLSRKIFVDVRPQLPSEFMKCRENNIPPTTTPGMLHREHVSTNCQANCLHAFLSYFLFLRRIVENIFFNKQSYQNGLRINLTKQTDRKGFFFCISFLYLLSDFLVDLCLLGFFPSWLSVFFVSVCWFLPFFSRAYFVSFFSCPLRSWSWNFQEVKLTSVTIFTSFFCLSLHTFLSLFTRFLRFSGCYSMALS